MFGATVYTNYPQMHDSETRLFTVWHRSANDVFFAVVVVFLLPQYNNNTPNYEQLFSARQIVGNYSVICV